MLLFSAWQQGIIGGKDLPKYAEKNMLRTVILL
jgi:hypothetical protein